MKIIDELQENRIIIPLIETPSPVLSETARKDLEGQVSLANPELKDIDISDKTLDQVKQEESQRDLAVKKAQRINEISNGLANPEVHSEVIAANMEQLAQLTADKNALERNTIKNVTSPNEDYYKDIAERVESKDELDRYVDKASTALMVSNIIQSKLKEEEEESVLEEIPDFFKSIFGVEEFTRIAGTDWEGFRTRFNTISQLPEEERLEAVEELVDDVDRLGLIGRNPGFTADALENIVNNAESDDEKRLAYDVFGALMSLTSVSEVGELGYKVIRTVAATKRTVREAAGIGGKRADMAKEIVDKPNNPKYFSNEDEMVDAQMILKFDTDDLNSLSGEYQKQLLAAKARADYRLKNSLAPEHTEEILLRNMDEMSIGLPRETILKQSVDFDEGGFNVVYGTLSGKPFKTKEAAQEFAKTHNIPATQITGGKEGFSIYAKILDEDQLKLGADKISSIPLLSWVNNTDNVIAPLFKQVANQAEDAAQGFIAEGKAIFDSTIKNNLKKAKEVEGWDKVIHAGQNFADEVTGTTGKWFDKTGFKAEWKKHNPKLEYKDKYFTAYQGYKILNDMSFVAAREAKYKHKLSLGLKGFKVKHPDGLVDDVEGVVEDISKVTSLDTNNKPIMVWDDSFGEGDRIFYTASKGELSSERLKQLAETHNLVKLDKEGVAKLTTTGAPLSKPSDYIFLPKRFKAGNISEDQIPYRAGGRRIQDMAYKVSVARWGRYQDGSVYRLADKVAFSGDSIKQVKQFSKKLTEAFDIAKQYKTGSLTKSSADDMFYRLGIHSRFAVDDIDEFIEWGVKKNIVDEDLTDLPVIQGLRDGEKVSLGSGFKVDEDFTDSALDFSGYMSRPAHRGDEIIPSLSGGTTRLLDPVSALARNLDQTARMSGFIPMRERVLSAFNQHYSHYLDGVDAADPMTLLTASVNESASSAIKRQIKQQQAYLKEVMSYKTVEGSWWDEKIESITDAMFDGIKGLEKNFDAAGAMVRGAKGLEKKGGKGVRRSVREALQGDPAFRAKSMLFHSKLGLGNIASFVQQFSHAGIVASIVGPKIGYESAKRGLTLRGLSRTDPDAIKYAAEIGWKKLGYKSQQDMEDYINVFRGLGYHNVDQTAIIMSGKMGSQLTTKTKERILELGKKPFDEGELASRVTAYGAAYLKWQDNVGGINPKNLAPTHPTAIKYLSAETHRLMLGMSKSDLQLGLRGYMSVPTQFLSYPLRAVTAMTPGTGKAFTGAEKARMALGYMALSGTAGLPLVGQGIEEILNRNPEMLPVEAEKLVTNGALDGLIYATLGYDTNLSSRIGSGQVLTDLWKKAVEGNFLEMMSGASGQSGWTLYDSMAEAVRLHYVADDLDLGNFTAAIWTGVGRQISSFNNIHKAVIALETGYLQGPKRNKIQQMGGGEALLMVLGLPPQAYEDMSTMFTKMKNKKEFITEAVKNVNMLHAKYVDAKRANDVEGMEEINNTLTAYYKGMGRLGVSDELTRQVLRDAKNQDLMTSLLTYASSQEQKGVDLKMGTILKKAEANNEEQ